MRPLTTCAAALLSLACASCENGKFRGPTKDEILLGLAMGGQQSTANLQRLQDAQAIEAYDARTRALAQPVSVIHSGTVRHRHTGTLVLQGY